MTLPQTLSRFDVLQSGLRDISTASARPDHDASTRCVANEFARARLLRESAMCLGLDGRRIAATTTVASQVRNEPNP